jgi:glycerol-3-phosphate dehydrogenase (NAD(P)+)
MPRVTVIGAGNWGTALAVIAARAGHEVSIWSRDSEVVESINREHSNKRYLKETQLPEGILATNDIQSACEGADLVILATPSHALREVLTSLAPVVTQEMLFIGATKGIEIGTGMRVSEIVQETLDRTFMTRYVCLSGPSFAKEVVTGHPTAVVAAGQNAEDCRVVQQHLGVENLRIYTNSDLIGVELGGAVKNVMAIAAGMVTGLGFGSNSLAALITRGLAEMTRLAVRLGARRETLMGLAGLGDLVLTSTGTLSRNRYVGEELGKGRRLEEICAKMTEVAEGVNTTEAVWQLAHRFEVETPITTEVRAVLYESKLPQEAVSELMNRPLKGEFQD